MIYSKAFKPETHKIPPVTEKLRLEIENPGHRMMVNQIDGLKGVYIYFMGDWLRLGVRDYLHMENTVETNKEVSAQMLAIEELTARNIKAMEIINGLRTVALAANFKFEIVLSLCLIIIKSFGAIDLSWVWVLSPAWAAVLFTGAMRLIYTQIRNKDFMDGSGPRLS